MAALQASGAISLQDIEEQYNPGTNLPSRGLSEFYLGGSLVRANAGNNSATNMSAGVPTSGTISFNDFYSKERAFKKTFSDGDTNQSADTIFGDDFEVDYPKQLVVGSGDTVGSTSTSNAALTIESNGVGSITVTNEGSIEGAGGAAGAAGGNAFTVAGSVAVTLVNNGTIKAGGGGGGAGGAGGKGVFTANATFSSLTDLGGGGTSTPQNNSPGWFTTYGSSGNNLDGVGVVGDRLWGGIGAQFSRGINPSQFDLNSLGGAGTGLSGNCANRGPIYFSAQTNTTGVYTVSASISSLYGSGYGTPKISVSTSTSSSGTTVSNSGTAGITASTTTYFTIFGSTAHQGTNSPNFYYNSLGGSVSGTCLATSNGGAGGAGGVGQGYNQSAASGSSGASGGSNAGSGGAGGAGGAFGADGSTGSTGSNGSGSTVSFPATAPTDGSGGSSGGASGKAINGISNVTSSGSGSLVGGTV